MTGSDLSQLWTLASLAFIVAVVVVVLLVSWLSPRLICVKLTRDTGVDRDSPAKAFAPG